MSTMLIILSLLLISILNLPIPSDNFETEITILNAVGDLYLYENN